MPQHVLYPDRICVVVIADDVSLNEERHRLARLLLAQICLIRNRRQRQIINARDMRIRTRYQVCEKEFRFGGKRSHFRIGPERRLHSSIHKYYGGGTGKRCPFLELHDLQNG